VPAHKVASSETVNLPLVASMAVTGKPLFISTGMCDLADVAEALEVVRAQAGGPVILLQCTSLYPTEPRHVHLRAMDTLRASFNVPVGLSEHTRDVAIAAAAVARGACVVEKHLTLDRSLPGPDHAYALEPAEFGQMVAHIRAVEAALGSPEKRMLPEEAVVARRDSLRAARDLRPGQVLAREDLTVERPGDGIRPRYLGAVIGRRLRILVPKGGAITWAALTELPQPRPAGLSAGSRRRPAAAGKP
jgi:N-acetylneuraminate synthase/N,N'-diacetyllegionaminate synthase